jgi:phosphate transport system ATP-binding protein
MNTSAADSAEPARAGATKIATRDLSVFYGGFEAVKRVTLDIPARAITSIIGPSGCGKSTLLRSFNRMNDRIRGFRIRGEILLDGVDVYRKDCDLIALRKRIGLVFQRPNPFPLSIRDNVAYGPRVHGRRDGGELDRIVEESLRATHLWDDLKDRLRENALALPPEQQQRLCIARLLAVRPEVLLMDEPCSALDPIATARVEELINGLKKDYTIVIVTHNMQQAARASDYCGFMWLGELVEFDTTDRIFTNPADARTEGYVSGRFG